MSILCQVWLIYTQISIHIGGVNRRLETGGYALHSLGRVRFALAALLLISTAVNAADQRLSVDVAHLQETLDENLTHIHAVEVRLNDGSVVKAKRVSAEPTALKAYAKTGADEGTILYTTIASIRLDLGARKGRQVTDAILLGFTGGAIGILFAGGGPDYATKTETNAGALIGLGTGAAVGVKLGSRHRKILFLDVKP